MALLTAAAIEDYKEFTQRNIAYSRVKVGGTYYKLGKPEIHVLSDGRIAADIVVDHTIPGTITATEFQLFNTKDQLFARSRTASPVRIPPRVFSTASRSRSRKAKEARAYV